jgi:hypothetical protein
MSKLRAGRRREPVAGFHDQANIVTQLETRKDPVAAQFFNIAQSIICSSLNGF